MFRDLVRAWRALPPEQRSKLKLAAELVLGVVVSLMSKRVLAVLAAAAAGGVTTAGVVALQSSSSSEAAPIKQAWITKAGPFKVERVNVPCLSSRVNLSAPPKGVGHTTEGGWAGAMSVFSRSSAPHFMVGRDQGRVRIVQFCPLGQIGAALKNRAGGVATNHDARAQIELVGFSQRTSWQPDAEVMRAYAALLYVLRDVAGIPLVHVPNSSRSAAVWTRSAGWFDHAGVPENDHWDMGAFRWPVALKIAQSFAPVKNPGHAEPKPTPAPFPPAAPAWNVCVTAGAKAPTVCHRFRDDEAAWSFARSRAWASSVRVRKL
jgi:hypothetical protein